jgi:hypothetical protein
VRTQAAFPQDKATFYDPQKAHIYTESTLNGRTNDAF